MTELMRIEDLPDLELIIRRWAVAAALPAAVLGPSATGAQPHGAFFDDGGGSWAQLILVTDGRAVLVGMDRDNSDTYREGIDLREGLPHWSLPFLPEPGPNGEPAWWGFVRVHDGRSWLAPTPVVEDGLRDHLLPVLAARKMVDTAADWLDGAVQEFVDDDDPRSEFRVDPAALELAVDLGPELTEASLFEVLPVVGADLAAGVAAARAFLDVTPVPSGSRDRPYPIGR